MFFLVVPGGHKGLAVCPLLSIGRKKKSLTVVQACLEAVCACICILGFYVLFRVAHGVQTIPVFVCVCVLLYCTECIQGNKACENPTLALPCDSHLCAQDGE